jgi:hypothetical protein
MCFVSTVNQYRMGIVSTILVLLVAGCGEIPQPQVQNTAPRYPMVVTCFAGELDSRSKCSSLVGDVVPRPSATFKIACGTTGGDTTEIEWAFLGHRGDKDAYRLTHRFPANTPNPGVSSKEVEFTGKRIVVFQDTEHYTVVESPR